MSTARFRQLSGHLRGVEPAPGAYKDSAVVLNAMGPVQPGLANDWRLARPGWRHGRFLLGSSDCMPPLLDVLGWVDFFASVGSDDDLSPLDISGLHRHHWLAVAAPCDVANFPNGRHTFAEPALEAGCALGLKEAGLVTQLTQQVFGVDLRHPGFGLALLFVESYHSLLSI